MSRCQPVRRVLRGVDDFDREDGVLSVASICLNLGHEWDHGGRVSLPERTPWGSTCEAFRADGFVGAFG
jgi:hypothetical protein